MVDCGAGAEEALLRGLVAGLVAGSLLWVVVIVLGRWSAGLMTAMSAVSLLVLYGIGALGAIVRLLRKK